MNKTKKIFLVMERTLIHGIANICPDLYMSIYPKYLKRIGINIKSVKYIDPSAYFDGMNYSLITIGENSTISREVMILTHDYSVTSAFAAIGHKIDRHQGEAYFCKQVVIGENSFIGARVSVLPGTHIGKNCIIGACAVVKGNIPDNSIVVGNPCKVIGDTREYAMKHYKDKDYLTE